MIEGLIFYVLASVYCDSRLTSGERMNCNALTAAHRTLPIGTCIRINNRVNVLINDRGPCFSPQCQLRTPRLLTRRLDLSKGAARALGLHYGVHVVEYKIVDRKECK